MNWNSFNVTCKNKRAIFTHSINFTGPLSEIVVWEQQLKSIELVKKARYVMESNMEKRSLISKIGIVFDLH